MKFGGLLTAVIILAALGGGVYWSNKATGITADVPSEAELTPGLWGDITIE